MLWGAKGVERASSGEQAFITDGLSNLQIQRNYKKLETQVRAPTKKIKTEMYV